MLRDKSYVGFTIIELLTVMVILTIIAGFMVAVGPQAIKKAKQGKAKAMIASVEMAISMYRSDTSAYPSPTNETNAELVSYLTTDPGVTGWEGPYIEFKDEDLNSSNEVIDPWENSYRYNIAPADWGNTNSYNLWSIGPNETNESGDEANDTDFGDDVHNW